MADTAADELKEKALKFASEYYLNHDPSEIGNWYDKCEPEVYREWARQVNFNEKDEICKLVFCEQVNLPKEGKILDAGCGPGILAGLLAKHGYTNIDGVDASKNMIDSVKDTGIYKRCDSFYFGNGVDAFPAEYKNVYDCCVASGVFMPKHMPPSGMDDIHASLKVGGYFITAMRKFLYVSGEEHGYFDKIEELIEAGKFKRIH
jgi:SAM-dependent methyltransferase